MNQEQYIFHVDVNSAFLSWEAVSRLQHGESTDLRTVCSAIGGNPIKRSGIILAASKPAKIKGVKTGEVLHEAFMKCPHLRVYPPDYHLYMRCSQAFVERLRMYSPLVQKFSIDECFMDMNAFNYSRAQIIEVAHRIKDDIKNTLGFTVNIGIGYNKISAKMASEFEKPDRVHTLFQEEIKSKLWPLKVEELFGVGRATAPKLHAIGVETIGDLAHMSIDILRYKFKSYGSIISNYAKGIEDSVVRNFSGYEKIKSIGHSTTTKFDLISHKDAYSVLLSLTEMVMTRQRAENLFSQVIALSIRYSDLTHATCQKKIFHYTDETMLVYEVIKGLFNQLWNHKPIRHLGIRVSGFQDNGTYQYSIFDGPIDKKRKVDNVVDTLRIKYGRDILLRARFLHSGFEPMVGGVSSDDYTTMISKL